MLLRGIFLYGQKMKRYAAVCIDSEDDIHKNKQAHDNVKYAVVRLFLSFGYKPPLVVLLFKEVIQQSCKCGACERTYYKYPERSKRSGVACYCGNYSGAYASCGVYGSTGKAYAEDMHKS